MSQIPALNPIVPFFGIIPGGFSVGQMLRIKGQMNYNADRFTVDIYSEAETIALHLSVRPHQATIVRNHKVNHWGPEERTGGCPITLGSFFEILILADYSSFKVAINGAHFCVFNYRLPLPENNRILAVKGECTLSYVGCENGPLIDQSQIQPTTYPTGCSYNPPPVEHHHYYETVVEKENNSSGLGTIAAAAAITAIGAAAISSVNMRSSHETTYSAEICYTSDSSSDSD